VALVVQAVVVELVMVLEIKMLILEAKMLLMVVLVEPWVVVVVMETLQVLHQVQLQVTLAFKVAELVKEQLALVFMHLAVAVAVAVALQ
jgi:hypothetical protein